MKIKLSEAIKLIEAKTGKKVILEYKSKTLKESTSLILEQITGDQLNTLKHLKRGQIVTLKKPQKIYDRRKKKDELINKAEIGWIDFDKSNLSLSVRGRMSHISFEKFFDLVNVRIIKDEGEEDFSNVLPTKGDLEKIIKAIGTWHTEYYPGGFPSNAKVKFEYKNENKAKSLANRIKSRKDIIKVCKGVKTIFGGTYQSPYEIFVDRAKVLKCSSEELKNLEDFKTLNEPFVKELTQRNYKF